MTMQESAADGISIHCKKSNRTLQWQDDASLLDFLEGQGFSPAFSCRSGVCGTCKTPIIAGATDYLMPPLDDVEQGFVLLCCSIPLTSLVLDL